MNYNHICIGRQLGSGGRVIARALAKEFNCKFYDKEILNLAAKESGFSEKFFEQNDEHKGFFKSLFRQPLSPLNSMSLYGNNFSQESLFQFQSDAIKKAAAEGDCVFVGRCADYILRDHPNLVNIFITADLDWRAEQVMKRHQCSHDEALRIIHNAEGKRSSFYNYYTGKRWGAAESYDICVNSSQLGIDATVAFLTEYINARFTSHSTLHTPQK
jgi:cytidylate kinase